MRGHAMGFGAFFVLTAACLLEILTGSFSVTYLAGALVGGIATLGYGGAFYNRLSTRTAPAEKARAKRTLERFR